MQSLLVLLRLRKRRENGIAGGVLCEVDLRILNGKSGVDFLLHVLDLLFVGLEFRVSSQVHHSLQEIGVISHLGLRLMNLTQLRGIVVDLASLELRYDTVVVG